MNKAFLKVYKGYTLVELSISIVIFAIILLLVSQTFVLVVKSSILSNSLITTRDEADLSLRVIEGSIKESYVERIHLYNSSGIRTYNSTNEVIYTPPTGVGNAYSTQEVASGATSTTANEIHFLPNGSERWICIGYFKDSVNASRGYILKTSYYGLSDSAHGDCFDSTKSEYKKNAVMLTSPAVNVKNISMSYYNGEGDNSVYFLEIKAAPVKWYGTGTPREILRQSVISTRKLTSVY